MGDAHAGRQLLRRLLDEVLEGLLVPADEALGRLLFLHTTLLFRVVAGLEHRLVVLDLMLGGQRHHHALGVEAGPSRAAHDLVELAGAQTAHLGAVELGELGEHHRVDRHVDADAERVGTADDWEQPLLGEALHEQAVARQHARMVHAHPGGEQPLQNLAEGGGELRALHGLLDFLALGLVRHAVAGQRPGVLQRLVLGEMHDVHRRLAGAQTQLHGGFQGFEGVVVGQRHGAGRVRHEVDGPPGALLQGGGDVAHVTEGGAHQQELRVRQREQRHLPGPAAIGVGVEVELVHHHAGHLRRGALAQGLVREDLRRAADDRRLGVDGGVSRDHAHVLAAEDVHHVEELLGHERLDGRRVVSGAPRGHGHEAEPQGHHGLAGACGRAQNHRVAHGQVHERVLLMGPQLHAAGVHPFQEYLQRLVGREHVALTGFGPGKEPPQRAGLEGIHGCDGAICVGAGGALGGFRSFGGDVLGRLVDALFGSGGVLGGVGHRVSVLMARSFAIYYK